MMVPVTTGWKQRQQPADERRGNDGKQPGRDHRAVDAEQADIGCGRHRQHRADRGKRHAHHDRQADADAGEADALHQRGDAAGEQIGADQEGDVFRRQFQRPAVAKLLVQRRKQPVRLEGRRGEADAGGIRDRIAERGGDRIVRALAHRLGAQRPDRVGRLGEEDLGARHVREGGQVVVAEFGVGDAAVRVDHHLLVERRAERLRDAALDLAAALHGDWRRRRRPPPARSGEFWISPVPLFTATRKPCTLKPTERGVPLGIAAAPRTAVRVRARASRALRRTSAGTPLTTASSSSVQLAGVAQPGAGGDRFQLGRKLHRRPHALPCRRRRCRRCQ